MYQTVHTNSKILIGLLIDLSGTMNYHNQIEKLNDGLEALYEQLLQSPYVELIELCVVTFGGRDNVTLVQPFSNPQLHTNTYFEAYGLSPLAHGMTTLLQETQNTIHRHFKNQQTLYHPILITLTDGIPTTDQYDENGQPMLLTREATAFKQAHQKFKELHTSMNLMQSYVIHFGDDLEDPFFLKAFASTEQHILPIDTFQIVPILKKLGQAFNELPTSEADFLLPVEEIDIFNKMSAFRRQYGRRLQKGAAK